MLLYQSDTAHLCLWFSLWQSTFYQTKPDPQKRTLNAEIKNNNKDKKYLSNKGTQEKENPL